MMATELEPTLGLPTPFPSSPTRSPKYVVRFENKTSGLFYITNFCELYAAKYPTALVLDEREWVWKNEKTIQCTDGMIVHSDDLEQIVEYKLTTKERQWVPPSPYYGEWHNIASGKPIHEKRQQRSQAPENAEAPVTAKKPRRASSDDPGEPQQAKQRERTARPAKDGLTSIATIAEQLDKDPKQCRIALRKSNTPKPDAGWAWPKDELESVKAIILKHIK